MHKRCFKIMLVLALMSLVLGSSVMPVLGHNAGYERGGYDYDQMMDAGINNEDWMSSLPDDLRISELSIPGTHDTMAWCRNKGSCGGEAPFLWVKCQSFSLDDQLKIGIRALDIRCRHVSDRFLIYHGNYHLDYMEFGEHVLARVIAFLEEHPDETVLMRIKETNKPEGNSRTFIETFEWYKSEYEKWIWEPTGYMPNPKLKDVRGKIVILDNFSGPDWESDYGIDWDDLRYVMIQDRWDMKSGYDDMVNKWEYIYYYLFLADIGNRDLIVINFLSAVGDGPDCVLPMYWPCPFVFASGHISEMFFGVPDFRQGTYGGHQTWRDGCSTNPRPVGQCGPVWDPDLFYLPKGVTPRPDKCILTGMNELILDKWIYDDEVVKKTGRVGIIMADFPSDLLADAIINLNPQNLAPVAICKDVTVSADDNCQADAGIDNGSYDPDGDPLTIQQEPEGPYELGETEVTLTVTDPFGESDSCTATVTVVDETPPEVLCNAPETIVPPDAPISFMATASDNCGVSSLEIVDYDCYKYTKKGKRIDKTESCVIDVVGDTITILDSGGVDDHITWTIIATDESGNTTETSCEVLVVNPGKNK